MMARLLPALALLLGLAAGPAFAQDSPASASAAASAAAPAAAPAPAPAARPPAPITMASPSAGNLLQTIAALAFVLGTLAVFAWAMKRYGPRHSVGGAGVRMVGMLNLGARERIVVVEVGDQWIVVGASPGRINALATMPRQEGTATLAAAPPAAAGNFADWLKQMTDKRNAN